MKQLFFKVLSVLVLISTIFPLSAQTIWDGTADTKLVGSGTQEDPYTISTAEQLAGLAKRVNKGYNYEGMYFKLTNDILLNDTTNWQEWTKDNGPANIWSPIGASYSTSFRGIFDGDNHIIAGLYINNGSYLGLFGYAIEASFDNIGLEAIFINGSSNIGALCGTISGEIKNCYAQGNVVGDYTTTGGLIGSFEKNNGIKGEIINCYFVGTVMGDQVGGLVGKNSGRICNSFFRGNVIGTDSYPNSDYYYYGYSNEGVGGLVGYNSGSIVHSHAQGIVNAENDCYIGGLVGYTNHYARSNISGYDTIYNCWSENNVTGLSCTGGLIGYVDSIAGDGYYSLILDCYTHGNVIGDSIIGGLIGFTGIGVSVYRSHTLGNIKGDSIVGGLVGKTSSNTSIFSRYKYETIGLCYTMGNVEGRINVGGIVGYYGTYTQDRLTDCYSMGDVHGEINVGGI